MNFKYKCWLQKTFSVLPKGEQLNYLFQRFITRNLPIDDAAFLGKVNCGKRHTDYFKEHHRIENCGGKYYEFGAGADLIIPLTIAQLGFEVYAIDLRSLVRVELVRESLKKFERLQDQLPFDVNMSSVEGTIIALKQHLNVHYTAPADARQTSFPDNYFDFSSSTSVLEHVPEKDILPLLRETYRVLKKGGICSLIIDYRDHWSFFDSQLSVYHFLQYEAADWIKFNPDLHFQNRLRHQDYVSMIEQTGFSIVAEKLELPNSSELATLKKMNLATLYQSYSMQALAVKTSELVLRK